MICAHVVVVVGPTRATTFRKCHLPQSPGESKPDTAHSPPLSNPGPPSVSPEPECVVIDDVSPPPTEAPDKSWGLCLCP